MELKTEDEVRVLVAYNDYDVFNEYGELLNKEVANKVREMNKLTDATETLVKYSIRYNGIECDNAMDGLNDELTALQKNVEIYDKYVSEKQENCKHEFNVIDNDSHYLYYRCDKCGKEFRE